MSINDRIADAILSTNEIPRHYAEADADAILAACPEIAALDHARAGWLVDDVAIYLTPHGHGRRVLVAILESS